MSHYLCREKYRLELHWEKVEPHTDGVSLVKGAFFTGPALLLAQEIEAPDSIELDMTPQCLVLLDSYYIVKFSWETVTYKDGKVFLGGTKFSNNHLETLHKLGAGDYLLIDTENHEDEKHLYNLVYGTQIVRADKEPYSFGV